MTCGQFLHRPHPPIMKEFFHVLDKCLNASSAREHDNRGPVASSFWSKHFSNGEIEWPEIMALSKWPPFEQRCVFMPEILCRLKVRMYFYRGSELQTPYSLHTAIELNDIILSAGATTRGSSLQTVIEFSVWGIQVALIVSFNYICTGDWGQTCWPPTPIEIP